MRAASLAWLIVSLVTVVAYAEDADKTRSAADRASKRAPAKADADPKSDRPLAAPEAKVVNALHVSNQTEIAAGKLAEKNTDNAAVLRYGRMLVKEHGEADRKLAAFARKRAHVLTGEARDLSELEAKTGPDFDSAFLTMMVKNHGEALALVQAAKETCEDREVRAILDQTTPRLQRHQAQAVKLQQRLQEPAPAHAH
jgi:predicted outer membrane protein